MRRGKRACDEARRCWCARGCSQARSGPASAWEAPKNVARGRTDLINLCPSRSACFSARGGAHGSAGADGARRAGQPRARGPPASEPSGSWPAWPPHRCRPAPAGCASLRLLLVARAGAAGRPGRCNAGARSLAEGFAGTRDAAGASREAARRLAPWPTRPGRAWPRWARCAGSNRAASGPPAGFRRANPCKASADALARRRRATAPSPPRRR